MSLCLVDINSSWTKLLPLTYTRPIGEIRIGILTIAEKWQKHFNTGIYHVTEAYLAEKYPSNDSEPDFYVNSTFLPNSQLVSKIRSLNTDEVLTHNGEFLASRFKLDFAEKLGTNHSPNFKLLECDIETIKLEYCSDIFRNNGQEIRNDFHLLTEKRVSQRLNDRHTIIYGEESLFVEEGASIMAAVIDASAGPVYIGENSKIEPGSIIRGPFAMLENATINMQTRVRGDSTIGPWCKVGGEISNTVFFGYSNKGHDGFIGNSVVGEWCNFGAGSNVSNLKNNYDEIKVWDYSKSGFRKTGLQFHGLIMGDHTKCGITSMFNTGSIAGVGANIFGAGFPRVFIPSFAWGGSAGFSTFKMSKFVDMTQKVMARRKKELSKVDIDILRHVFEMSEQYRIGFDT